MDSALKERIEKHISSSDVVLFMKGTRTAPQCGFSATVVGILDTLVEDYETINVLADGAIREGIKEFSDWPTIPQLYVRGEFLGGCDIVKEMYESGQLEESLGVEAKEITPPTITVTATAAEAFGQALQGEDEYVRLQIDARYDNSLTIGPKNSRDIVIDAGGLRLVVDRATASRAEGVTIDFVTTEDGQAFKITNPSEPPRVRNITPKELKAKLDAGPIELFDVRTEAERAMAKLDASRLLDRAAQDHIMSLDKATPLYFVCHHGPRSGQAAEFFLSHGFKNVFNVVGGIDRWSVEVDDTVPRY